MESNFIFFNGVKFFNNDIVRVTYCENRSFDDSYFTNTFTCDEVLQISDEGVFLCTNFEGITFKRNLNDFKYSNVIFKIEKLCN